MQPPQDDRTRFAAMLAELISFIESLNNPVTSELFAKFNRLEGTLSILKDQLHIQFPPVSSVSQHGYASVTGIDILEESGGGAFLIAPSDWKPKMLALLAHIEPESEEVPANGPVPPNYFWWAGEKFELQPRHWQLVDFLWRQPSRMAKLDDVIEHVWGDSIQEKSVASAVSKLNSVFLEAEIPLNLGIKNGYVVLAVSTPPA